MTDPRSECPVVSIRHPRRAPSRSRSADPFRGLARSSVQQILARLADGDPLGLVARVDAELRRRHLLLDRSRVVMRAWSACAREVARGRGRTLTSRRLDQQVRSSVESLLAEGVVGEDGGRQGVGSSHVPTDLVEAETTEQLSDAARANFNRLPFSCREAFFRLVIEGRSIESLLHAGGPSAITLARRARKALLTLSSSAANSRSLSRA